MIPVGTAVLGLEWFQTRPAAPARSGAPFAHLCVIALVGAVLAGAIARSAALVVPRWYRRLSVRGKFLAPIAALMVLVPLTFVAISVKEQLPGADGVSRLDRRIYDGNDQLARSMARKGLELVRTVRLVARTDGLEDAARARDSEAVSAMMRRWAYTPAENSSVSTPRVADVFAVVTSDGDTVAESWATEQSPQERDWSRGVEVQGVLDARLAERTPVGFMGDEPWVFGAVAPIGDARSPRGAVIAAVRLDSFRSDGGELAFYAEDRRLLEARERQLFPAQLPAWDEFSGPIYATAPLDGRNVDVAIGAFGGLFFEFIDSETPSEWGSMVASLKPTVAYALILDGSTSVTSAVPRLLGITAITAAVLLFLWLLFGRIVVRRLATLAEAGTVLGSEEAESIGDDEIDRARRLLSQMADANRLGDGVITVLFTDIVESTALFDRLGDEPARDLLREHDTLLRASIGRHAGVEVSHRGDGLMAVFSSARRAVRCAVDMQRALTERNAMAAVPINIRIGLNTGEVVAEEENYFGQTVIIAARIMDLAEGGHIVVSELTKAIVGADMPFVYLGSHSLKGLSGAHALFVVPWEDVDRAEPTVPDAASSTSPGS
jgi:class 3 adenylate cyclase